MRIWLIAFIVFISSHSVAQVPPEGPALRDLRGFTEGPFTFSAPKTSYWGPAVRQGGSFLKSNERTQVPGFLILPRGTTGKVPAMVVMHGIGGLYTRDGKRRAYWDYAAELARDGIAAVLVDTHGARGLGVTSQTSNVDVSVYSFVSDAFAAADMLRTHPLIDAERIGIMGFSKGGLTTLLSTDRRLVTAFSATGTPFKLHIAIYPGCQTFPQKPQPTGAPVRMLLGEKDNFTGISGCAEIQQKLAPQGVDIRSTIYKGAYHGWDEAVQPFKTDDLSSADCRWSLLDSGEVEAGGRLLQTGADNAAYVKSCLTREVIYVGRVPAAAEASMRDVLAFSLNQLR